MTIRDAIDALEALKGHFDPQDTSGAVYVLARFLEGEAWKQMGNKKGGAE